MKVFAERLKELRKNRNISTDTFGKAIGVSDTAVCNWENNKHDIKGEDLVKIALFFGVSADYLLGLSDG